MANGKNVKTAVKAAVLRQEIVKLSLEGWSNQDIARYKDISEQTVNNHFHKFLESSRYPVADQSQVDVMRREKLVQLEQNQRTLVQHMTRLHHLVPADNKEECEIAGALCKCADSYVRCNDHIAEMFGLLAPKVVNGSGPVTNNTLSITEEQLMEHIATVRGLNG